MGAQSTSSSLAEFEWPWVDAYGQNDDGWQGEPELRRFCDGPHLYPLETVPFLIEGGLAMPSMPPGVGCPRAADLQGAFTRPSNRSRAS